MRDLKTVTVLIVDDDEALRKAVMFDFKRKGFNVLDAKNGREAFALVENSKVDIVVTDVRMPGGDGIELLDRIKDLNPELPVVMFITGFTDLSIEDAYDKGVHMVLAKPFSRSDLMKAVLKVVAGREESLSVRPERVDAKLEIEVQLPGLDSAIQSQTLNLGRGGMFIALQDSFPEVGFSIQFKISFGKGDESRGFGGHGVVRWVRTVSSSSHPSGCGVEFEYLEPATRDQIIRCIDRLQTRAYIPKG